MIFCRCCVGLCTLCVVHHLSLSVGLVAAFDVGSVAAVDIDVTASVQTEKTKTDITCRLLSPIDANTGNLTTLYRRI